MPTRLLKSVIIGIKRRWKTGLTQAFGVAGAIWLITEIATKISKLADEWVVQHGDLYGLSVLSVCLLWFLRYSYETRSVSFTIPTTDTTINIVFGDIFEQQTDWLIGVNEFFDSELGHIVSQDSVHGKFITNVFNGDGFQFRTALDRALINANAIETERPNTPSMRYDIGTTAILQNGSYKAFLVAMSKTDLVTSKASSSVPLLWNALNGALHSVRAYGNGATLSMPLLGNGQSSVNIEPQHLMRLIVLALVDFGRKYGLPKKINIIVHEACFQLLDIREIRRDWSKR